MLLIFSAVVFSVMMIVVGSLHADRAFTDSLMPGVIHTNCSLIEFCGRLQSRIKRIKSWMLISRY